MKLKVCGMRDYRNIQELGLIGPDFMGFIFYKKSKRFVGNNFDPANIKLPESIEKVGVFVNASKDYIFDMVNRLSLDFVQLHGGESSQDCQSIKERGIGVIKVLSVNDELPTALIEEFEPHVDYFLFDTKTPTHGGSGLKFDWDILRGYSSPIPYFLSGGIRAEDINEIGRMTLPGLFAIDVNSGVEIEPGIKHLDKVKETIKYLSEHPSVSPLKGRVPTIHVENSPIEGGKGGVKPRNRIIPYKPYLKKKAKELRNNSTTSEILLWIELKNRQIGGYQFHRQVPMLDYIVDFYCHELGLVIEIDGDYHEYKADSDFDRQNQIEEYGIRFLRFEDIDVKQNMGFILEIISNWISKHG